MCTARGRSGRRIALRRGEAPAEGTPCVVGVVQSSRQGPTPVAARDRLTCHFVISERATATTIALTVCGVVLAGCTANPAPAADTAKPTPSNPTAKLAAALSGVEAGRYSWTMTYPDHQLKGAIDRPGHVSSWTQIAQNQPGRITRSEEMIGTDDYVKYEYTAPHPRGFVPDGYWEHFDYSRIQDKPDPDPYNPIDLTDMIKVVRPATTDPDGAVHGTLNLRDLPHNDVDQLSSLPGWDAGPLKCNVTFDQAGHFTGLTVALPADNHHPAADLVITADAYGVALSLPKPTPTGEAPAAIYGNP